VTALAVRFIGDLVLLKARSGCLFVHCPLCGLAFDAPPEGVDVLEKPDAFAPEGFVLPDATDVLRAVREGWSPSDEGPLDESWRQRLGPEFMSGLLLH
jgi:hypothetical protein